MSIFWRRGSQAPQKPQTETQPAPTVPVTPKPDYAPDELARLSGRAMNTTSFNTDDLTTIINIPGRPYEDLMPVKFMRLTDLCFASTANPVSKRLREDEEYKGKVEATIAKYRVENAKEYKEKAQEHRQGGQHKTALKAIEEAVTCDTLDLALWKTAGDIAIEAGEKDKAGKYYQIASALPTVRKGRLETINEADKAVVYAAANALKKL